MTEEKRERKKRLTESEIERRGFERGYAEAVLRMRIFNDSLANEQKMLKEFRDAKENG